MLEYFSRQTNEETMANWQPLGVWVFENCPNKNWYFAIKVTENIRKVLLVTYKSGISYMTEISDEEFNKLVTSKSIKQTEDERLNFVVRQYASMQKMVDDMSHVVMKL